ncbi:MAG TPA: LamG domain-containing protein [Verrucomicrobiae bacterium]|nr:LamG domain-containing protein [Verrucomicrobiae bacterium]
MSFFSVVSGSRRRTSASIDLVSNLTAHWTLDNTLSDSSGGGRTLATGTVSPTFETPGRVGTHHAKLVAASSQYFRANDWFYSDVFTISIWAFPETVDGNGRSLIIKRNSAGFTAGTAEWALSNTSTALTYFCHDASAVNAVVLTGPSLPVNTWSHVVVVQRGNGNPASLYINGVEVDSQTQVAAMRDTASQVSLGVRSNNDNNRYWNGRLDDARVYIRALNSAEVSALAAMGTPMSMIRETYGGTAATSNLGSSGTQYKASKFTPASSYILEKVEGLIYANGTPSGTITGFVWADNAGVPGTILATSTNTVDGSGITTSTSGDWYAFEFSGVALTSGTPYWFGYGSSTVNGSNFYRILCGNAGTGDIREGTNPPLTNVSSRAHAIRIYASS